MCDREGLRAESVSFCRAYLRLTSSCGRGCNGLLPEQPRREHWHDACGANVIRNPAVEKQRGVRSFFLTTDDRIGTDEEDKVGQSETCLIQTVGTEVIP
jgi:hypothetical protein